MLKPLFDITVLKRLLRVVVFNMPFKNKFVQVILGDSDNGFWPEEKDMNGMKDIVEEMKKDTKNFGDTTFLITHGAVQFRPMSIEKLKKKIMFVIAGNEDHKVDDLEFRKIELEVKAAFESAKLPTSRVVVLRYPVQMVSGDTNDEEVVEDAKRARGVDTKT